MVGINFEDWEQRKLETLVSRVKSYSLSRDVETVEYSEYRYVHYGDIHTKVADIIDESSLLPSIKPGNYELLGKYDLILADASEDYQGIATPAVVTISPSYKLVAGLHTIALRPISVDSMYLYYILNSRNFRKHGYRVGTGMKVFGISVSNVLNFEGRFPSKDEQHKVGKFLKKIDDTLALHQKKLEKLELLKKCFLQLMFPQNGENVPRLRFANSTAKWKQRKLGAIGTTFSGLSGKTKKDFGHGNAEYVVYVNINKNPVANLEEIEPIEIDKKQNEIEYGDVLFTTSSEIPEEVGMSSVWLGSKKNVYLNSFCFGYRIAIKVDYYFIAYLMRSSEIRNKIKILAQGISRYNISKNKLMELEILMPDIEEQIKLGNFFKSLDKEISAQHHKLLNLKVIKKNFQQNMFI